MSTTLAERTAPLIDATYPPANLGLEWSEIELRDGYDAARQVHKCEFFDSTLFSTSADRIADLLVTGEGKDVIVGRDDQGKIQAVAVVEVLPADGEVARVEISSEVHPDFRGRGIGQAILEWQKARGAQLLLEAYGPDCELPAQIATNVDGHLLQRVAVLEGAGFEKQRQFQVMYRDLDGEEPTVDEPRGGYTVVPWIAELEAQIKALHLRAFSDHWGSTADAAKWWEDAIASIEKRWSFVAISPTGEVSGYILVVRHPARWLHTGMSEAYAELLGVDPNTRGSGLARALITKATKASYDSGMQRMGLDVDMDNPHGAHSFYERLGFKAVGNYFVYSLDF